MEEDHLNILIVDSSVCYNARALLICGNMWLFTNIPKMHPKVLPTIKKIVSVHEINPNTSKQLYVVKLAKYLTWGESSKFFVRFV